MKDKWNFIVDCIDRKGLCTALVPRCLKIAFDQLATRVNIIAVRNVMITSA